MSDKLFDILLLLLIGFILGVPFGEHLSCKKMGLKYSWDYAICKGDSENE